MVLVVDLVNFNIPAQSYIQILSDSSNNPELECLLMTRVSFGLTGLNQLEPEYRGCVFVQLDS